jgi:hypothetical protein
MEHDLSRHIDVKTSAPKPGLPGLGLWLSGTMLAWHVQGPGFDPQHHTHNATVKLGLSECNF